MALSRQTRIKILLVLDVSFFIIEIVIGYWIKSLAIIADSFHMLNDILSLIVALYALKLASKTTFSSKYSYGWQRAEVLGALVNGVFLMALCFSILIEAIERLFDVPEIKRPEIIFGVGCAGLFSNLIGLLLFHEHSHGHSHSHHHEKKTSKSSDANPTDDNIAPIDEILVHPVASRQSIVLAAQETALEAELSDECLSSSNDNSIEPQSSSKLENSTSSQYGAVSKQKIPESRTSTSDQSHDHHDQHNQRKQGHSHGNKSLNMQGVFLHVLGDALGNIGVIATGLFIYLTNFSWRFYADPIVSLILTVIIFSSAVPLVKSASFILLQGVPSGIPIEDVRSEIKKLPGVLSVHELHIWQLSDTKRIGSVHVLLAPSADYAEIAANIRKILHVHGIHSSTIQPEYVKIGLNGNDSGETIMVVEGSDKVQLVANEGDHETACLLRCNLDPSCAENSCCPPTKSPSKETE
ncbi:3685_t:CDS:2 [Funneliformis geosporum]|uniref:3436_t:CDS:1 n=1 Tax=Funneliformis geosporum TaxID=1117311 RepID=A0A9W4SPC0_9GLOM|nr:3436_t:CDS:2 [Funneliformis geosporum]CAI2176887.1 3685_t:CDS:2 [Funneliformis geosporum]